MISFAEVLDLKEVQNMLKLLETAFLVKLFFCTPAIVLLKHQQDIIFYQVNIP